MLNILYLLSWLLSAPFYALTWLLYGIAWVMNLVGDTLHDHTTHRLWLLKHKRECERFVSDRKAEREAISKGEPFNDGKGYDY